jgi:methionyl-tRNA formyltransferase
MRVLFMGTPEFAVPSLRALAGAHDVACVFTRPDRPAGRGRHLTPTAVKAAALALGIPVEQPERLDSVAQEVLRAAEPDVVVVVAYGLILGPGVLAVPRLGCVNVHASLLPRWRGAAPIERAILAGDAVTGVSIMRMDEGLDTGPWASRTTVPVEGRTAAELAHELSVAGADALLSVLADMEGGTATWTAQDDAMATYAAKISATDVVLAPALAAEVLARRVRASGRTAPSRALIAGRAVVVTAGVASDTVTVPGGVAITDEGLLLGAAHGSLRVDSLVPSGKRPMSGIAFARGARLDARSTWGDPA